MRYEIAYAAITVLVCPEQFMVVVDAVHVVVADFNRWATGKPQPAC